MKETITIKSGTDALVIRKSRIAAVRYEQSIECHRLSIYVEGINSPFVEIYESLEELNKVLSEIYS